MNKMWKIECKRAFCNKWFILSLLLGCAFTVSQGFVLWQEYKMVQGYSQYEKMQYELPVSLFSRYIGLEGFSVQSSLFFLLIPILAVIPYAHSFLEDSKSGYLKSILLRTKKFNYMFSKCSAAFLAAGTAVVIPLLINLLLTAMMFPAIPQSAGEGYGFTVNTWDLWHNLFYYHPFMYVLVFLLIDFVYAGLFALLSVVATFFIKKQFIILLFPFLLYEGVSLLATQFGAYSADPNWFLRGAQVFTYHPAILFGGMGILILLAVPLLIIRTKKMEVY